MANFEIKLFDAIELGNTNGHKLAKTLRTEINKIQ